MDEEDYYDTVLAGEQDSGLIRYLAEDDLAEDRERWAAVGDLLRDARQGKGLSKRAAAEAAGFSEGLWRHLEMGVRLMYGQEISPNPRNENLAAAARAMGIDPRTLFEAAGRTWDPPTEGDPGASSGVELRAYRDTLGRVEGWTDEERALAEAYIAGLRSRRPVTDHE